MRMAKGTRPLGQLLQIINTLSHHATTIQSIALLIE